jgi:hypothetical protein
MNKPEQITVTIHPGDLLNNEDAARDAVGGIEIDTRPRIWVNKDDAGNWLPRDQQPLAVDARPRIWGHSELDGGQITPLSVDPTPSEAGK